MTDRDWIIATYDEIVAAHADAGVRVEEARVEFMARYAEAVTSGAVSGQAFDDMEIGAILFDQVVRPARSQRRSSWKSNLGYLGSILLGEEVDGDLVDPILNMAFPVGDGSDKTLRLWSEEDWKQSVVSRYRNAADATAAAAEHDRLVGAILDAFATTGAVFTRDLFANAVAS